MKILNSTQNEAGTVVDSLTALVTVLVTTAVLVTVTVLVGTTTDTTTTRNRLQPKHGTALRDSHGNGIQKLLLEATP